MTNSQGTITAVSPPAPGAGGGGAPAAPVSVDNSLPDATRVARIYLALFLLLAIVVALIWNAAGTGEPFKPSMSKEANFALFSGFYVAAQVIERLLELVAPLMPTFLPGWTMPPTVTGESARAAQVKADRAKVVLGIGALAGVAASAAFGLYFLRAVGIDCSRTVDVLATGITIAGGTKPLHDFITSIQNKNTPKTGTGTTA
ncbi:MAG: hypothetical protein QOH76_1316 [Thermoleophilaceae bacterium]|jgi:hypothetical protein|nr:hypothetical protein [Thermoleophilaceae bacterium]